MRDLHRDSHYSICPFGLRWLIAARWCLQDSRVNVADRRKTDYCVKVAGVSSWGESVNGDTTSDTTPGPHGHSI